MTTKINIGSLNDFPLNQTKSVTAVSPTGETINACIARWDNGFYAFIDSCSHAHAPLGECDIENGEVSCPLHGARFSVTTGNAITLPAVKPLKMIKTLVEGNELLLEI